MSVQRVRPSERQNGANDLLVTFDLAEDYRRGLTESVSAARFERRWLSLGGERHKRSYRSPNHFGCPTVIYVQLSRRSQSSWVGVRGSAPQPHPAIAALLGRFLPRLGSLSTTPAAFLFVYTATSAAIPRQLRDVGRESVMRTKADPADARACVSRPSSKC